MTDTNARQIELTINHPDNQLLKEVRQRVEEGSIYSLMI